MIKRTVSYAVVRSAITVVAGLSLVIAIRLLGPAESGKMALVAGLIAVASPMLALGTDAALARYVVNANRAEASFLYLRAYVTLGMGTAILIGLAWLANRFQVLPAEAEAALSLAILNCGVYGAVLVNAFMLRGLGRWNVSSIFEGFIELGPRVLIIPLVLLIERSYMYYLYAQLATLSILLSFSLVIIWRSLRNSQPLPPAAATGRRLPQGYWLYATQILLANILGLLFVNLTVWMLRYNAGPREVGLYSVGQDVPSVLGALLLMPLVAPLLYFYTLDERLQGRSQDILQGIVVLSAFMGGLSLALAGLAPLIVRVVFGVEFIDATPIFVIYSVVPFLIACHPMLNALMFSQNQVYRLNLLSVGQLIFVFALSLYSIPRLGAVGAAWAVVAAYVAGNIAYALLMRRRLPGIIGTLLRLYGLFVPFVILGQTRFWYLGLLAYPGLLAFTRTLDIDRLRMLAKSASGWPLRSRRSEPKVLEP
jgi:O-antigen/teichoic acid export membrane protein